MPELANVGQVALQILTPECRVRNIVCVGGEARGRWGSSNPHPPPSLSRRPPTHSRTEGKDLQVYCIRRGRVLSRALRLPALAGDGA